MPRNRKEQNDGKKDNGYSWDLERAGQGQLTVKWLCVGEKA